MTPTCTLPAKNRREVCPITDLPLGRRACLQPSGLLVDAQGGAWLWPHGVATFLDDLPWRPSDYLLVSRTPGGYEVSLSTHLVYEPARVPSDALPIARLTLVDVDGVIVETVLPAVRSSS